MEQAKILAGELFPTLRGLQKDDGHFSIPLKSQNPPLNPSVKPRRNGREEENRSQDQNPEKAKLIFFQLENPKSTKQKIVRCFFRPPSSKGALPIRLVRWKD